MARILFVLPECYVLPQPDAGRDHLASLSSAHEGQVLLAYWGLGDQLRPIADTPKFRYDVTHTSRRWGKLRGVVDALVMVRRTLYLHYRDRRFDVIVAYGTKPGIVARLVKLVTGVKVVAEIPGTPATRHLYNLPRRTRRALLQNKMSRWLVAFVIRGVDHVRLGYPDQLAGFSQHGHIPSSVFHYFVPIGSIKPTHIDAKYILSIGFPWYLKGVDVLIKAFRRISGEFPGYRLKIIGHAYGGDREYFETLRAGRSDIEFERGVPYDTSLSLISNCSVLVLASRTESMGRVLLEAMACQKPIVASQVEGIPHYIQHEQNGLLFESENVQDLAFQLKRVLSDAQLAAALAKNGYDTVHERYSEARYAEEFDRMIQEVTGNVSRNDAEGLPTPPPGEAASHSNRELRPTGA